MIASFIRRDDYELTLYARTPERVAEFLHSFGSVKADLFPLNAFGRIECDVIINCVGIGDPGRLRAEAASIFELTETWDKGILDYLRGRTEALYINLSSGAAYGGSFEYAVTGESCSVFPLNALTPSDYYGIAKLHSEARHRAAADLNIVDLRVFSYFSRYLELSTRFLLTDIALCIKSGEELVTTPGDIIRDYVDPDDLFSLIELCIKQRRLNEVYDAYSKKPVGKFEMLDEFVDRFGLKYRVMDIETVNATGNKENYYSTNHRAAGIGYAPAHTSLETLCTEMKALLEMG